MSGNRSTECQVVSQSECGPSNHLLISRDVVKRSLTEAIDQVLESGGLDRDDVVCISAGMAGIDFDGAGAAEIEPLLSRDGFRKPRAQWRYGDRTCRRNGA